MDATDFVNQAELIRKNAGIKTSEMCESAGISVRSWYHWMTDGVSPSLSSFLYVLECLGCEMKIVSKCEMENDRRAAS